MKYAGNFSPGCRLEKKTRTFSGTFSSETEAAGSHSFILAAFRSLEDGYTTQLCNDFSDWTATWQGPAQPQPAADLRVAPGDGVTTYSDGKTSFQFVKKAAAPR